MFVQSTGLVAEGRCRKNFVKSVIRQTHRLGWVAGDVVVVVAAGDGDVVVAGGADGVGVGGGGVEDWPAAGHRD